jgi:uncharacterized protein with FMN-binding domain
MDQQPTGKKREIIAALAVLIVIVAIVAGASFANKKDSDDSTTKTASITATSTPKTSNTAATTDTTSADTTAASAYKDGSYSATASYDSPGGTEKITIDVTLQNGVVTATSATSGATDPEASEYQGDFISGYKQLVVGKKVESISLSRVSGSSLTSQGFNSALTAIKKQAQNG